MRDETVHQEGGTVFAILSDEQQYQARLKAHEGYNTPPVKKAPISATRPTNSKNSKKKKAIDYYKEVKQLMDEIVVLAKKSHPDTIHWIQDKKHIKYFKEILQIIRRHKLTNVLDQLFTYSAMFKSLKDMLGMHNRVVTKGKSKSPMNEKSLYKKILSLEKILFQKP